MYRMALVILIAVVVGCMGKEMNSMELAQDHYANSRYNKAISACDAIIASDPDNVETRLLRGRCFLHQKDFDNAMRDYSMAISLEPNNHKPYYFRAQVYALMNDKENELADRKEARRLDPDYRLLQTMHGINSYVDSGPSVEQSNARPDNNDDEEEEELFPTQVANDIDIETIFNDAPQPSNADGGNETALVTSSGVSRVPIDSLTSVTPSSGQRRTVYLLDGVEQNPQPGPQAAFPNPSGGQPRANQLDVPALDDEPSRNDQTAEDSDSGESDQNENRTRTRRRPSGTYSSSDAYPRWVPRTGYSGDLSNLNPNASSKGSLRFGRRSEGRAPARRLVPPWLKDKLDNGTEEDDEELTPQQSWQYSVPFPLPEPPTTGQFSNL